MSVTFEHESELPVAAAELSAWYARPGAFERLAPPWPSIDLLEPRGGIESRGRFVFAMHWGRFASCTHLHRFESIDSRRSRLVDHVDYTLPLGRLGERWFSDISRRDLERIFRFRHRRTLIDLQRHSQFGDRPRLKVAISGASGFVGRALAAFLSTGGHDVRRLVRSDRAGDRAVIRWDPQRGILDHTALERLDAVIHLAGAGIADKRWSARRKAEILQSRTHGTRLLAEAIAACSSPPPVLISASAVGYYGSRSEPVTEDAAPGSGFLVEVCRAWEAAADPARAAGVRVIHPRLGVVLGAHGGVLAKLRLPFRCGLGGVLGDGQQGMSWIALDDVIGAIHWMLFQPTLSGAVNLTAPGAVDNRYFTKSLGAVLRRPTFLKMPASLAHLLFGELADEALLGGQFAEPAKLVNSGFSFLHHDLGDALRSELGLAPPDGTSLR